MSQATILINTSIFSRKRLLNYEEARIFQLKDIQQQEVTMLGKMVLTSSVSPLYAALSCLTSRLTDIPALTSLINHVIIGPDFTHLRFSMPERFIYCGGDVTTVGL